MTISQRIFAELNKQNKTQKQMSEFTGIPTSTISAWNKNGTNPSADSIYSIAQFLNISLEYLLTGEEKGINVINTGDINGNNVQGSNNVINSPVPHHVTELVDLIEELPLVQRAEAVLYLNDLKNKK